jgi:hypothetical protein
MNFRLLKKSTNAAISTFHILNEAGEACGSVNVPNKQAEDLKRHWKGAYAAPAAKPKVPAVRLPQLSKKAILRGC